MDIIPNFKNLQLSKSRKSKCGSDFVARFLLCVIYVLYPKNLIVYKVGNDGIFVLLKWENKLGRGISNSKSDLNLL